MKTLSIFGLLVFFSNCAIFNSVSQVSQSSQSISSSLQSISTSLNSISSISSSISGSSSSNKDKNRDSQFKKDIRDLTCLYLKSGSSKNFFIEIENISMRHGISDWKRNDSTYLGIGEGFSRAGLKIEDIKSISSNLPQDKISLLKKGYNL